MKKLTLLFLYIHSLLANSFFYHHGEKIELEPVMQIQKKEADSESISFQIYRLPNGKEIYLGQKLFIKLKKGATIEPLQKKYGFVIIKSYENFTYLIQGSTSSDILDLANALHEEKSTVYSQPEMSKKVQKR